MQISLEMFFSCICIRTLLSTFWNESDEVYVNKPDVAAKVKMGGILWTTGSWIVMSMTAKQGATRTKLEIYCNRKTSNWRNKEDNHVKIKKHGGLLTQVGYVEIGQQYTLAKRELLPIFFVCIQKWRDGVNYLYFFQFCCQYIITFASYDTKICCNSFKGGKFRKWSQ